MLMEIFQNPQIPGAKHLNLSFLFLKKGWQFQLTLLLQENNNQKMLICMYIRQYQDDGVTYLYGHIYCRTTNSNFITTMISLSIIKFPNFWVSGQILRAHFGWWVPHLFWGRGLLIHRTAAMGYMVSHTKQSRSREPRRH